MNLNPDVPMERYLEAGCRNDFLSFVRACFHTLNPNTPLLMNWHISALTYELELILRGESRRLIVNEPPRSLKSLVCSIAFPAFLLGHDPTKRIIVVSYSIDLAVKLSNDFRIIVNSPWYRALFPMMRISPIKNTELEIATDQYGYRLATSLDGSMVGRGATHIIIDDYLKPSDAPYETKRTNANNWFFNTALSRLDDKLTGVIVVVGQRLHGDDLAGTLLQSSNEWRLLSLPAIAEEDEEVQISDTELHIRHPGDVLHAEREPREVLDSYRAQVGSDIFDAQFQQRPKPPGGVLIQPGWLREYDQPPKLTSSSAVIQSWDVGHKVGELNDWSVCTTWLFEGTDRYLLHVVRVRLDFPALNELAVEHARTHKAVKILVEDAGLGTGLISFLEKARLPVLGIRPEQDKTTRMQVQSVKFQRGEVFFPRHAPWRPDVDDELFAFPNSAHDDICDSISQALAYEWSTFDAVKFFEGLTRLHSALAFR